MALSDGAIIVCNWWCSF